MTTPRQPRDERLLAALDSLLGDVDLLDAVKLIKSYLAVLERRIEIKTRPLDLFTLPHDLPRWEELYADLVARAITETASVTKAADAIGRARATLYNQLHKGILDAHVAANPDLASVLGRLLSPAP